MVIKQLRSFQLLNNIRQSLLQNKIIVVVDKSEAKAWVLIFLIEDKTYKVGFCLLSSMSLYT